MKKILIDGRALQSYSKYRGIGRYTKQIIDTFKDDERFYFLFFNGDDIPEDIKRRIEIKYPRKFITFTDKILLKSYLKKEKIDIYHSPAYAIPKKVKGIKFFLTVHDITPLIFPENYSFRVKFVLKKIIESSKNAETLIADSNSTKKSILNHFSFLNEDRIKVLYPFIREDFCLNFKKPNLKLPDDFILYVGGFDWIKNVESIIKAVKILKIPVVLAGMISDKRKKELTKDLNYNERNLLFFTGFVSNEELSYLYRFAKLFVFLSLNEGFGYPPLEALKCGTISVLSNRGSLREVMGECGVYVENPLDIDEITFKIKSTLENSSIKEKIIKTSKKIINKFSEGNFKINIKKIYDID